jgi:acetoacetyl-CoA reductase
MEQKVALVTGGIGGIGSAIVDMFAEKGYRVYASALPQDPGIEAWQAQRAHYGDNVRVIEADVTDRSDCELMIEAIIDQSERLDVLVNCAGITRDRFFSRMSEEQWHSVIDTNLNSVFNVTQPALTVMLEQNYGRIINISSVNGVKGQAGQTNYSAAKAGLIGFTKALAQEVASRGITVNAIAPGYVATDMVAKIKPEILQAIIDSVPMRRLATPEEIAGCVEYLASDKAGYITGAVLNINGGLHM